MDTPNLTPQGAVQYSAEQIEQYISMWQESGLSRKAFSSLHGLKYGTFKNWVYKRSGQKPISVADEPSTSFVALEVNRSPRPGSASIPFMELTLANGSHLSFYQAPPMEYLRELLK